MLKNIFKKYPDRSIAILSILLCVVQLLVSSPFVKLVIFIILLLSLFAFIIWLLFRKIKEALIQQIFDNKAFCMEGKRFYEKECAVIRSRTLQCIFDYLIENDRKNYQQMLKKLGAIIANDLLKERLKERLKSVYGSIRSREDVIKQWGCVETECYWGKFDISIINLDNGRFHGEIKVNSCILSRNRTNSNESLCSFLIGYFEVIISDLAEFPVEVKELNCGKKFGDGICNFSFEPKEE